MIRIFDYVIKQVNEDSINLLKINNENTKVMRKICLKLTITTPERRR